MVTSWISALALTAALAGAELEQPRSDIFDGLAVVAPQGKIDELVFGKLKQLGIQPAHLCSDGVFVRRVYLDVIGTLPTADEARKFLLDQDPDKRRALIDRLLQRKEFADYWAMKWSDVLRVEGRVPHQSLAQRGAGLSPLDRHLAPGEQAVRPVRAGTAHLQRQQFPRAPGQLLPRHAEQGPADHRPHRGLDVHGRAGRELAQRAAGGHGRLLLADRLQVHRGVEGGDRLLRSGQGHGTSGRRGRRRRSFPTGRRSDCRPTRTRARSSPTG